MSKLTALLSSNWYRVAHLKPRLRGHARIHRHAYRGAIWYVVEDRVAAVVSVDQVFRLPPGIAKVGEVIERGYGRAKRDVAPAGPDLELAEREARRGAAIVELRGGDAHHARTTAGGAKSNRVLAGMRKRLVRGVEEHLRMLERGARCGLDAKADREAISRRVREIGRPRWE